MGGPLALGLVFSTGCSGTCSILHRVGRWSATGCTHRLDVVLVGYSLVMSPVHRHMKYNLALMAACSQSSVDFLRNKVQSGTLWPLSSHTGQSTSAKAA